MLTLFHFLGKIQDELPVGKYQHRGQTLKNSQGSMAAG